MKLPSVSGARPNLQMLRHLRLSSSLFPVALLAVVAFTTAPARLHAQNAPPPGGMPRPGAPNNGQQPNSQGNNPVDQDPRANRFQGGSIAPQRGPADHPQPPAAASSLPPTQPTSLPAPVAPLSGAPPTTTAKHAIVTFENGLLLVKADDSSLNQILHSISRRTGMTITGGVADTRIFGEYGPAAPSTVLATLLDGTGVNMLLREGDGAAPLELVLTLRTGGPTPPSPNEGHYDDAADDQPPPQPSRPAQPVAVNTTQRAPEQQQPSGPPSMPQPQNNPLGNPGNSSPTASTLNTTNSVPTDTLPTPSTAAPAAQGIVDAPNPPPPGSTSNSNGTATPEQIYEQLLKMQQQQSKSPTTPTPAPQ